MIHDTGKLTGKGGVRLNYGYWLPEGQPKAAVMIAHGIGEHMGRYKHVLEALAQHGYAAFALDHRGHGSSEGPRNFVPQFDYFVDDLHELARVARDSAPRAPLFLVGHSMGSLIAIRYALRHQDELAGLVVSGVALQVGEHVSPLLKKVGALISRFAPHLEIVDTGPKTGESLLSRDPEIERLWDADPLTYKGRVRARIAWEIGQAAQDASQRVSELHLPLLIMHGSADLLANVKGAHWMAERVQSKDKTLRVWEGSRHEILNEIDKKEVIAFLIEWLDARADKGASNQAVIQPSALHKADSV